MPRTFAVGFFTAFRMTCKRKHVILSVAKYPTDYAVKNILRRSPPSREFASLRSQRRFVFLVIARKRSDRGNPLETLALAMTRKFCRTCDGVFFTRRGKPWRIEGSLNIPCRVRIARTRIVRWTRAP